MYGSIPNPCPKLWKDLEGDDRRRFCQACGTHVHAIGGYSDEQWRALAAAGPVCAYSEGETAAAPRSRRAVVAGALLTTIAPLLAQSGTLRVRVADASGAVVAGSTVTVACAGSKEMTVTTNTEGVAVLPGLPAGTSQIRISQPGFKLWRGEVTLVPGQKQELSATLALGAIEMGVFVGEPRRRWLRWLPRR